MARPHQGGVRQQAAPQRAQAVLLDACLQRRMPQLHQAAHQERHPGHHRAQAREAGKGKVGKGGVVRDEKIRNDVINDIKSFFIKRGYTAENIVPSPILGPKGNKEYIISLKYSH